MARKSQRTWTPTPKAPEKGNLSVAEAGRLGGEKVRDKYGPEFYSEIGHKGGQKVKELIEKGKQNIK
jgi:general stress protein YciG